MKKVIQIIPNVGYGDAVGNDTRAIAKVLAEMGYETGVYSKSIDKRLKDPLIHDYSMLPKLSKDDVVIFNHCTGTDLSERFKEMKCRKMMIYHNITPPKFFEGYSRDTVSVLTEGYRQTKELASVVEYCMPVSEFNAEDLRSMGYKCPMFIRPILIPFDDYKVEPEQSIIDKYKDDGYVNILFVGRIAPNKKQEDVIAAFNYYNKYVNRKSRLFMVGSDNGMQKYSAALKRYVQALDCENVIFTGHTPFREILSYYKISDVFLCMSEHEGFCVPLVESMFFDLPIIAYDSCAVPDTLGGSGVLVKEKDPVFISLLIDRIVKNAGLRESIVKGQRARLADFSYESIRAEFEKGIRAFVDKN